MIYWLKKLEWKIRKALGLHKKRVKTIDDVQMGSWNLLGKVIILICLVMLATEIGKAVAHLWWWFFPKRHWLPVIHL